MAVAISAVVASLGAPLITSVAVSFQVSLGSAQWTLTVALFSGAVATLVLGRLGAGPYRRVTILVTLAVVVAGGALTVLSLSFAWLLAGRAAQGVGLGLTALMMGVARDHLPEERSAGVIALVSVVWVIGAGVGCLLAALLTELGGVRAAYGLALVATTASGRFIWSARCPRGNALDLAQRWVHGYRSVLHRGVDRAAISPHGTDVTEGEYSTRSGPEPLVIDISHRFAGWGHGRRQQPPGDRGPGALAVVMQPDEPDGVGVDRLDRMPPPCGRWHPTGRAPEPATRFGSADRRR
ncbi:MFS transporter [Streptomyces sp. NPDC127108]|uniref:MFS transporter n=1 Tax=Streptomyces sp. NPDC127108 TaxID=3345361 RepID=UPI00362D3E4E